MLMRILVTGSRTWTDRDKIARALLEAAMMADFVILVEGGAAGADTLARDYCDACVNLIWRQIEKILTLKREEND